MQNQRAKDKISTAHPSPPPHLYHHHTLPLPLPLPLPLSSRKGCEKADRACYFVSLVQGGINSKFITYSPCCPGTCRGPLSWYVAHMLPHNTSHCRVGKPSLVYVLPHIPVTMRGAYANRSIYEYRAPRSDL